MRSREYDYLEARLIEEREAAEKSATPEARRAHRELALRYAQRLDRLEQESATVRGRAGSMV